MIVSLSLADLTPGECAYIQRVDVDGATGRRLLDLGFLPGTKVQALFASAKGDPIAYVVRGAVIALRKEGAKHILIKASGGGETDV